MKQANEKSDTSPLKKYPDGECEQRSSLPDIQLSKWEKSELESSLQMQNSHSSESILKGLIPPPKPSKDRKPAPPLPPKRKTFSVEDLPDGLSQPDRSFDFNEFDDDDCFDGPNERERSIHSSESKTINEIDLEESVIKIRKEINSRIIQSGLHEVDNSFRFMSLNHSSSMLSEQSITSNDNVYLLNETDELPPPLPIKTRSRSLRLEHKSVYDNVEGMSRNSIDTKASTTSSNSSLTSSLSARTETVSDFNHHHHAIVKSKYKSCIEPGSRNNNENPPPLPLKKKHSKYRSEEKCSQFRKVFGILMKFPLL